MFSVSVTLSNPFSAVCICPAYAYPVPSGIWVWSIQRFCSWSLWYAFHFQIYACTALWLSSRNITNVGGCFPDLCPGSGFLSTFLEYLVLLELPLCGPSARNLALYLPCSATPFPQVHHSLGSLSRRTERKEATGVHPPTWDHSFSNWWGKFSSSELWAPIGPAIFLLAPDLLEAGLWENGKRNKEGRVSMVSVVSLSVRRLLFPLYKPGLEASSGALLSMPMPTSRF